jgi:hypothetical protein
MFRELVKMLVLDTFVSGGKKRGEKEKFTVWKQTRISSVY